MFGIGPALGPVSIQNQSLTLIIPPPFGHFPSKLRRGINSFGGPLARGSACACIFLLAKPQNEKEAKEPEASKTKPEKKKKKKL